MLAPASCSPDQGGCEGVFWCAGGSCSPQTLSLLTRSSSSSPLGTLKHQVLWSWVMIMWWCHGLGWGDPTLGSPACGSGWTTSLVFFAQSSTNPLGTAAPASRRSQDIQGLSPRRWSEDASAALQRSLGGRGMGSKAVPMAKSHWERGLLAFCLMRLCLMQLGKRALLGRTRC